MSTRTVINGISKDKLHLTSVQVAHATQRKTYLRTGVVSSNGGACHSVPESNVSISRTTTTGQNSCLVRVPVNGLHSGLMGPELELWFSRLPVPDDQTVVISSACKLSSAAVPFQPTHLKNIIEKPLMLVRRSLTPWRRASNEHLSNDENGIYLSRVTDQGLLIHLLCSHIAMIDLAVSTTRCQRMVRPRQNSDSLGVSCHSPNSFLHSNIPDLNISLVSPHSQVRRLSI